MHQKEDKEVLLPVSSEIPAVMIRSNFLLSTYLVFFDTMKFLVRGRKTEGVVNLKMSLLSFWSEASLWGKLGYIILAIALYFVVKSAIQMKKSNALQIMQFIKKNQDEGNVAVGRMSCWSKHGYDGKVEHYETEYMYIVDGKSYYITYAISCSDTVSLTDQEKVDTVDLALEMPSAAIIYYDPKNPKKAHIKKEVFCDADEFYRIKTKKNNRYRSVGREWILPVDLISD